MTTRGSRELGSAPEEPTPELVRLVEGSLRKRAVRWRRPQTGLSPAQRFVVRFEDGSSVFVKAAVDAETERWLRTDHLMMSTIDEDFVPEVVAWIEAGVQSALILEDLHDAYWPADHLPVEWKPRQWDLVIATLERIAVTPAHESLPALSDSYSPEWPAIAANPEPFLELGLCSARWFERSLDKLVAAETALDLSGNALVHCDVRSDNLCFRDERVVLVDWSDARRGSARHDLATLLNFSELEGGPDPYTVMPDGGSHAAWRGAQLARRAAHDERAPKWLKKVFQRGAILNLQWAARCLDLPPWEGRDWREL